MSITHITDHYELAVARLPEVYKDKPRFLAWLAAYCTKIQQVEDVLWEVFTERLLQNNPTGDLLAKLGRIVGQVNILGTDSSWRLFIQARILVNRSDGRRRTLTRVVRALWPIGSEPAVWQFDFFPASVMLVPQDQVQVDPYVMAEQFIGPSVGAGIRLSFVWSISPPTATVVPASVHAVGFVATPPCTTPDIGASQFTGSVHHSGFAAGPPPTDTGGGTLAGVIGEYP